MADRRFIVYPDVLSRCLARVLREHDVPADQALATAHHLVEGLARGYPEHGAERIFQILDGFHQGTLRPTGQTRIVRDTPAFVVLDGDKALGIPVALEAVRTLIDRTKAMGMAAVGTLHCGHLGILAPYAERLAEAGLLGIVTSTTEPAVVGPGGSRKLLGTNPIAFAFPTTDGVICADFATSSMSRGELLARARNGTALPRGAAVDRQGHPTTEPLAAIEGGLLPFDGSHKGFFISVLLATLAGPAIGAAANHVVTGTRSTGKPPTKGDLFLAIDLAATTAVDQFKNEMANLLTAVRTDIPGSYLPGTGSRRRYRSAIMHGVEISDRLWCLIGRPMPRQVSSG